ncbi:hypothetical protein SAMN05444162_1333 [Paenibacillaceae bacterium GAS479]|nr:hypothetical protein SAMN05444162_1333 [Paenibacillaceae bacterium GAS479]
MDMNATPRDAFNGNNSIGIFLVLFILTAIVSSIFLNKASRAEDAQQDAPVGIAASRAFHVYNESIFTLTTIGIYGDFERRPPAHTINAGGSYGYQISLSLYKTSIATVYYSYEYRDAGVTRTGNLIVDMIADTNGVGDSTAYMRLYTTGPINYYREDNYSTYVRIRN